MIESPRRGRVVRATGIAALVSTLFLGCGGTGGGGTSGGTPGCTLSWRTSFSWATGGASRGAEFGDLNGDGKLDVVAFDGEAQQAQVFLGNGATLVGAFEGYMPADVYASALADIDGDSLLDLLVTQPELNAVGVMRGDGTGAIGVPPPTGVPPEWGRGAPIYLMPVGDRPMGIAVGDFDEDGNVDFVSPNETDSSFPVFLGGGDGTFLAAPGPDVVVGRGPHGIAAFDADLDGHLDLAVANTLDGTVNVLLGVGDGTFLPGTTLGGCTGVESVAVGDVNGDRFPDLVVSCPSDASIVLFHGNDLGGFDVFRRMSVGRSPGRAVLGDFDGDGVTDIAVPNRGDGTVHVFLSRPGCPVGVLTVGSGLVAAGATDANGDGLDDLLLVLADRVMIVDGGATP